MKQIEQYHRVIEEWGRFYYAMLLFNSLPMMMVVHLMITVSFYINDFVWINRFSKVTSLLTIVEGTVLKYNLHFRVMF